MDRDAEAESDSEGELKWEPDNVGEERGSEEVNDSDAPPVMTKRVPCPSAPDSGERRDTAAERKRRLGWFGSRGRSSTASS